jgi:hypothetical protein
MAFERVFRDIRYFESDHENIAGIAMPCYVGRIFKLPASIGPMSARIACKLREYRFVAPGGFHHLYVNYTTTLPEGQFRYSPHDIEYWFKFVDYGLSPQKTNRLSESAKESLVCRTTFEILRFIAGQSQAKLGLVNRVQTDIIEKGSELEILHKRKETAAYVVSVTYQIRPNGKQSVGLVAYRDKKSGKSFKTEFVKLKFPEDILFLVGSISVSRGRIRLKPRPSFKASLYTKEYKTPIAIRIAGTDAA